MHRIAATVLADVGALFVVEEVDAIARTVGLSIGLRIAIQRQAAACCENGR